MLLLALLFRMIGTYFAVHGGELNVREKIFMAFAWLPKATVQAALGPIFLDNVKKVSPDMWRTDENEAAWIAANPGKNITEWAPIGVKEDWEKMGENILTLAVMSILITAPLGAVCILGLGPKLLHSDNPNATESQETSEDQPKTEDA